MSVLSKFQPPSGATDRPLRILVYGYSKQGKSHFVHTATEIGILWWIDTEGGSDFYDPDGKGFGFKSLKTDDPSMAIAAISEASERYRTGAPRPTVAIDSFSSMWFAQQEVARQLTEKWSHGRKKDRASYRAWGPAKAPLKALYDAIMKARCHVVVTARAKEEYEVSASGEPKAKGATPDVERNLAYAMDLQVLLGVDDLPKGKPAQPDNFKAVVMGSRDRDLPTGTALRNPKLADFLVVSHKGEKAQEVHRSAQDQVDAELDKPDSWGDLVSKVAETFGWDEEKTKQFVKAKFGKFEPERLGEYWTFLKEQAQVSAQKEESDG